MTSRVNTARGVWRAAACALALAACERTGEFDRLRCEQVVELVRARVHDPGRVYRFRLNTSLDPASLTEMTSRADVARGEGRGYVRASLSASRALAVSIETRDDGHAGEYGVLYADPGCARDDVDLVRRDSQREERIDARWLRWKYDLD